MCITKVPLLIQKRKQIRTEIEIMIDEVSTQGSRIIMVTGSVKLLASKRNK